MVTKRQPRRCGIKARAGSLALALCAGASLAQAPAASQIWDVQLATDCLDAPAVGITLRARVAITPNTAGTANFGVLRAGGAAGSLLITITDPNGNTPTQGALLPGLTREVTAAGGARVDSGGRPLEGLFHPFRGFLVPLGTGGSNDDPNNGLLAISLTGSPTVTSIVCTRQGMWDGVPRGRATIGPTGLIGEYADVFRFLYVPQVREGVDWNPTITLTVQNLTARYIYSVNGATLNAAPAVTIPTRTLTFEVPVQPVVLRQPQPPPDGAGVCPGSNFTLNPHVGGLGPMQFQWLKDGQPVAGATAMTLAFHPYTPADAGTYRLVATGSCGSTMTNEVALATEMATPPVIRRHPVGGRLCPDTELTLEAEVEGGTLLQWTRNRARVTGANAPTLVLQGLDEEPGTYRIEVEWPCGLVESNPAVVAMNVPPQITRQPRSLALIPASDAIFTVEIEITDPDPLNYRWSRAGVPMQESARSVGTTGPTLRLRMVSVRDAGLYRVTISDGCAETVSAVASLLLDENADGGMGSILIDGDIDTDTPPCIADVNADGVVDGEDLALFLTMYFSGADLADVNGDGKVNADDLTAMLDAYATRCR